MRHVHQGSSPLLRLIAAKIPADDAFVVQLACESLHLIIRCGCEGGEFEDENDANKSYYDLVKVLEHMEGHVMSL